MRMLFVGTHGSENPTHAALPFLSAQGALEEGHEVEIALMGDAVVLMKEVVAKATVPVGWPPVGEVLAGLITRQVPIHV